MESEANKSTALPEDHKVPEELLQRLHEVTEQFHLAEKALEAAMADTDFQHQQKVSAAEEQLRVAEREVEKVTMEVQRSLKPAAEKKGH